MNVGLASAEARSTDSALARQPAATGFVVRDGVRIAWERYGRNEPSAPAVLLMPTWQIVHSRSWKLQVPDLARRATVLTFDPPGNGRSDRPRATWPYDRRTWVDYALAVLDSNDVERAVVMAWCDEGQSLWLAAEHPERVAGLVLFSAYPYAALTLEGDGPAAAAEFDPGEWPAFVDDFFGRVFSEPHSSKPFEDAVAWGLETD